MWSIIRQFIGYPEDACRLCRAPAGTNGLCVECTSLLPLAAHCCQQCGLPIQDSSANRCGECLVDPPAFDAALIPFIYSAPVSGLIARLKFHGDLPAGRILAAQLADRLSHRQVQLLVPMPLHQQRLRERGFNQASELCRQLSRHTGIPWDSGRLMRTRAGSPQRESNRQKRQRNVRNAFQWRANAPCPQRVALVDDVVTTGATARAAAACLKRAGAEWVEIWAVARTAKGKP